MPRSRQPELRPRQSPPPRDEAGYMLLAVVVMTALLLLSLAIAAPVIARDLRRDKEVESEHRAQQYWRAIRLYYKRFGQYPPSMEALEKSNNIRFLRQQYVDPLTGKADWRIIRLGQQKTTIKVPFGQELAGIATTGLGSAAGMTSGALGGASSATTGTSLNSGCTGLNAAFCNQPTTTSTSGGGANGGSGATGSTGGVTSTDATKLSGGGGPIAGVGTSRTGDSILAPNQQTTYDTWEFWYDPRIEQLYKRANILGGGGLGAGTGGGINSTPASSFGQDAVSGQSNSRRGSSGATGVTNSAPQ